MKQSINPTVGTDVQIDINLTEDEVCQVQIMDTFGGRKALWICVNGVNLLRLYSKQEIILNEQ